jgi:hypothetical protein
MESMPLGEGLSGSSSFLLIRLLEFRKGS